LRLWQCAKQASPQSGIDAESDAERPQKRRRLIGVLRRKTAKTFDFRDRNETRNDETYEKHFGSCAERLPAVDGTPFGDFPAEKAS
jgi:hypothetical protein